MNIYELENHEMNLGLAYILGMIYPLYTTKKLNGKQYILGSVNHNHNMITQEEIDAHYLIIYNILKKYIGENKIDLKTNKCAEYTISPKKGFSMLIENTNVPDEKCIEIMTKRVKEIKDGSDELKIEFVKGCFDGRASWDKNVGFLSVDVRRDYEMQDLIQKIIKSLGIDLNINRRSENHKKHDQIRIKKNSINDFMKKINLYSVCRENIIKNAINNI